MHGHDLFKLHQLHGIVGRPTYAKTAAEQSESKPCPPSAYADLAGLKYPCHTKEAAFNSCLLAADAGVAEPVTANLNKLATFWGILGDVNAAREKIAAVKVKTASPDELSDDEYALVQDHNGTKLRKFAAFDGESTVAAAEAFHGRRHQYPFTWRKTAAERLLKMASLHGAILPAYINTYLLKAACLARPTTDSVDEGLVQRMNIAHRREEDVMSKVAALLDKMATAPDDFDSAAVGEVLDLVDQADREVKLAQHYETGRVALPEEMLVVQPRAKVAAAAIRLVNGRSVDPSVLTKEALAAVDEGLAAMSFAKLAEVLPTLPRPEADLLSRLVTTTKTAADVAPAGTEAAAMGMNESPSAADFVKQMGAKPAAAPTPAPAQPGVRLPVLSGAPVGNVVDPMTGAPLDPSVQVEANKNRNAVNQQNQMAAGLAHPATLPKHGSALEAAMARALGKTGAEVPMGGSVPPAPASPAAAPAPMPAMTGAPVAGSGLDGFAAGVPSASAGMSGGSGNMTGAGPAASAANTFDSSSTNGDSPAVAAANPANAQASLGSMSAPQVPAFNTVSPADFAAATSPAPAGASAVNTFDNSTASGDSPAASAMVNNAMASGGTPPISAPQPAAPGPGNMVGSGPAASAENTLIG